MSFPVRSREKQMDHAVRILIADYDVAIRRMVRSTLEQRPEFEVVGEAHDGVSAIEQAQELRPDVVVLNVIMPVLNGLEAARRIKSILPETAIVILSTDADQRFIDEAKKAGARTYVAETKSGQDLIHAIDAAIKGGEFVLVV